MGIFFCRNLHIIDGIINKRKCINIKKKINTSPQTAYSEAHITQEWLLYNFHNIQTQRLPTKY